MRPFSFTGSARFRELRSRSLLFLCSEDRGSALAEGAVVLPVLLILMFGIYDFSWLFYQQHVMSDGVRNAARQLSRSSSACDSGSPKWLVDQNAAEIIAVTGSVTGGLPRIAGWSPTNVAITCTPIENPASADGLRAFRGNAVIYTVTVSSRLTNTSLGFFRFLGLSTPIISVSHSERVIGPG